MCNRLGRLSQGWKSHADTDNVEFIFHHDMPRNRKVTYGKVVWDIRPQRTEIQQNRITAGGNLMEYPGEVSPPVEDLTTVKLHVNSIISNIIYH